MAGKDGSTNKQASKKKTKKQKQQLRQEGLSGDMPIHRMLAAEPLGSLLLGSTGPTTQSSMRPPLVPVLDQ